MTTQQIVAEITRLQTKLAALQTQKTMKIRNYMTGKEQEIPADTPWSCNPAGETFWSM